MSHSVQFRIEALLPQGQMWKKHGIFSAEETAQIFKKRKQFEERVSAEKFSYGVVKEYSDYELAVLQLTRRRVRRRERELKRRLPKGIINMTQASLRKLFRRATNRNPCNARLWMLWADVMLQAGLPHTLRRVLGEGASVCPKADALWALYAAAATRFDSDWDLARAALLRGLRFQPASLQLLSALFRGELDFVARILHGVREAAGACDDPAAIIEDPALRRIAEGGTVLPIFELGVSKAAETDAAHAETIRAAFIAIVDEKRKSLPGVADRLTEHAKGFTPA